MAQITKTVDKTLVNGSEVFIYTINAAYSGLTIPAHEGKIIDVIPSKIKYVLPPVGGQIQSITETPVENGTQVTFNLGSVNSGTSLSFTLACNFGPGRVDDDSYTNYVELVADGFVVEKATAPTVRLKLDENFVLTKFAEPSNIINAGEDVTFVLSLTNNGDFGATIKNVVVTDTLPPQLTPVTDFTPVGNDISSGDYSDNSANGLTGSWENNTLTFKLPKYSGARYDITFKAKVDENLLPGQSFENIANWTMNDNVRNNAQLSLSIYDPNAAGFELLKLGSQTTTIDAPISYEIRNRNSGNITLSNYELEDIIPDEVDITAFEVYPSGGLVNYSVYIALASDPSVYIPVITNIPKGSYPYKDITSFIPDKDRLTKIKLTAQNLLAPNSKHSLYIYGKSNSTAVIGSSFINKAVAKSGDITQTAQRETLVNGASDLFVEKDFFPIKQAYYPLEEFNVILTGTTRSTISINPILADLMPFGLHYVVDSEYYIYYDNSTGEHYDSRNPDFPIPIPTREIVPNFADTDSTLVRWNFSDLILGRYYNIKIIFKVFVGVDTPNSFINKGYMSVYGDNVHYADNQVIDILDIDGDGLITDRLSCKEVSGIVLSTSEFSLKKLVKGQNDLEYSNSGVTIQGGDIDYQLQITNNQPMNLKNIEIIDILPFIGDTGVILESQPRGSQFNVYATSLVTAEIINVIGEPVEPNPNIIIEYSESSNPKRFDELGALIGTGEWSLTPPVDITAVRSVKVTTDQSLILHPYERLIINIKAKAPAGTPVGKIAYNSYAVRANKITTSGTEPLLPTEPNKVQVTIAGNKRGSIGDFVWQDLNQNGLYDEGELGINGVTVELYDNNQNLLKTTVTTNDFNGNSGYYLFPNLAYGVYQVKFIPFGEYSLTQQQSSMPNGSKPNPITALTPFITMSNQQQILDIDAGLIQDKLELPVIYAEDKCVHVGDMFDPMESVTAKDYKENDITDSVIVIYNDVDTYIPDLYTVTYSVTDSYGQTATSTIQVIVCQTNPRQQAITDIFESVALEQTALSHILNAEGEKIQKAKSLGLSIDEMIRINNSVEDMVNTVSKLESVLKAKLELFKDVACCSDDCCDINGQVKF